MGSTHLSPRFLGRQTATWSRALRLLLSSSRSPVAVHLVRRVCPSWESLQDISVSKQLGQAAVAGDG